MTPSIRAWKAPRMTSLVTFTVGVVGILLVQLVVAELRDLVRARRGR
jgi:hypothetical protein